MAARAGVAWDDALLDYQFGPGHPMNPIRLDLAMRLTYDCGIFDLLDVDVIPAVAAKRRDVELVHTPAYVAAVEAAGRGQADAARGLGTQDIPLVPGIDRAAARVVGGSVELARAIWDGKLVHGVNMAGGLHHAHRDAAAGFCIYNDAAVAIAALLERGARRIAYIDFDAHHGDGVQAAFWDDPRVLTVSIHQAGIYPHSGVVTETGGVSAPGSAVNVPLLAGTDSSGWLRAIDAIVPDAIAEFGPDVIVSQHGADGHRLDAMSDLLLSVGAMREAAEVVHRLAHEFCGGRWLALGGGGYEVSWVVPMVWTHVAAIAAHHPIALADPVPGAWRRRARELGKRSLPRRMGAQDGLAEYDAWTGRFDPGSPVDQAIRAARRAGLGALGVDVTYDL
ncbi:acetoin utilization protein AcuC [Rarobacter faecitabidus]|uniref:Acetoin utilization protein AcuC n=1 Tax=Rarobacter faecitabidus TaxID=13243 RepID=A0A542ZTT8_RARFA|nr:acetoin utilization protein AcuC [Rarobacter faecitabidus]TQL63774.1 acetoin utilization protein AcuC [Rarobacter faecitabidus]